MFFLCLPDKNIENFIKSIEINYYLDQGSANCGPRARYFFECNAARERKFCGPRACKCGPLRKNIF